eukprot:141647-Rhodomonas_salina.2
MCFGSAATEPFCARSSVPRSPSSGDRTIIGLGTKEGVAFSKRGVFGAVGTFPRQFRCQN